MSDRSGSRRLIVNADHVGLSQEVNQGTRYTFRCGTVRGASLVASGPAFEHALKLALHEPALDVGVHLAAV